VEFLPSLMSLALDQLLLTILFHYSRCHLLALKEDRKDQEDLRVSSVG